MALGALSALAVLFATRALPAGVNEPGIPENELHIARLVYNAGLDSGWGPGRAWWRIDWPEAEMHFTGGVQRYTGIDIAGDSVHVTLLDDALFDYPWLFAQQVGRWTLSAAERKRLREYLLRGGFLVVDDFHGDYQWEVFRRVIVDVLPEYPILDVPANHALMNVLYDLDQSTQIPGRRHLIQTSSGIGVRMDGGPPRWRGIYDERGRLIVAINFNMDMGDAWEHADDPVYPLAMTSLAYRFGINYLVYALTH